MISTLDDLGWLASVGRLNLRSANREAPKQGSQRQSFAIALDNLDPIIVVVSAMLVTRFVLDSVTSDLGAFLAWMQEPSRATAQETLRSAKCRAGLVQGLDDQKR